MYESFFANILTGLNAPYNVASIIPVLMYITLIYFLLMYFRKEERSFSENPLLSYMLVAFVFLGLANVMNWVHNTSSLTHALSGTTFYSLRYGLTVETLKIPGYAFILATMVEIFKRMKRL